MAETFGTSYATPAPDTEFSANLKAVRQLIAQQSAPEGCPPEQFAAWYAVATTLLNLDEMITRN